MEFDDQSYVVLYSHSQKLFQIETVIEMVKNNKEAYAAGRPVDWVVMNIVENKEKARELVDKYKAE